MTTHWVGQNSGPIFRCLRTKVHHIKFACVVVSVVYNAIFWYDNVFLRSRDIRDEVTQTSDRIL